MLEPLHVPIFILSTVLVLLVVLLESAPTSPTRYTGDFTRLLSLTVTRPPIETIRGYTPAEFAVCYFTNKRIRKMEAMTDPGSLYNCDNAVFDDRNASSLTKLAPVPASGAAGTADHQEAGAAPPGAGAVEAGSTGGEGKSEREEL